MVIVKLMRSPDVTTEGGTGTAPERAEAILQHHKRFVPDKDDDLANVAQLVATKWSATSFITLLWMLSSGFATLVANYLSELAARKAAGGSRSPITDQIETLDMQIEDGVREVKAYISDKFGSRHATANFPPFGIVHENKMYILPRDHQQRSSALQMMIDAIAANGFGTKTYGTTFWTDAKTNFDALQTQASGTDATVSGKVSAKVTYATQIKNVLHSLILVLHANYPDTYHAVIREWGMQKEDY